MACFAAPNKILDSAFNETTDFHVNLDPFPRAADFGRYDDYKAGCEQWATKVEQTFQGKFLPVPIGFWHHSPLPPFVASEADLARTPMRLAKLANGRPYPQIELELQDITINGEKFDGDRKLKSEKRGWPSKVEDYIDVETPWCQAMMPMRPMPYMYAGFDDYRSAMEKWLEVSLGSGLLIPHPREMEQILKLRVEADSEKVSGGSEARKENATETDRKLREWQAALGGSKIDFVEVANKLAAMKPGIRKPVRPKLDVISLAPDKNGNTNGEKIYGSELCTLNVERQSGLKRCGDFKDIQFESSREIIGYLSTATQESYCYKYSVLTAVCSGFDMRVLKPFNDLDAWYNLALIMNEQLLVPEVLFKYTCANMAVVAPARSSEDLEKKRTEALQLYRALVQLNYATIGHKYYVLADQQNLYGCHMFEEQMMRAKLECQGLMEKFGEEIGDFLATVSSEVLSSEVMLRSLCVELVNFLKAMVTFLDNLEPLFKTFKLHDFMLVLASRDDTLLADLTWTLLRHPPALKTVVMKFFQYINTLPQLAFAELHISMIHVFMSFLAVTELRDTNARAKLSLEFFVSIIQLVSDQKRTRSQERIIYAEVLHSMCFYIMKTIEKEADKSVNAAWIDDIPKIICHESFFTGELMNIENSDVMCHCLWSMKHLLNLRGVGRFIEKGMLPPPSFNFLYKLLDRSRGIDVTIVSLKVIGVLMGHRAYMQWLLSNQRRRETDIDPCQLLSALASDVASEDDPDLLPLCYELLLFLMQISINKGKLSETFQDKLSIFFEKNDVLDKIFPKGHCARQIMKKIKDSKGTGRIPREFYVIKCITLKLQQEGIAL